MAELKTKENNQDVDAFLAGVSHEKRRVDACIVKEMMERLTGQPARMWGSSIVGFGAYDYTYPTGNSGRWMMTGFSPRKTALTIYIMPRFSHFEDEMERLGKYKTGKSCLYINKLEDIDMAVLEELVLKAFLRMKKNYTTDC